MYTLITCRFCAHLSRVSAAVLAVSLIVTLCDQAWADPLPGEVLKFYQTPLNNGLPLYPVGATPTAADAPAPFPGHDELSTAYLSPTGSGTYSGTFMADDFSDFADTPIYHVTWWGSYMNGSLPPNGGGVTQFLISFESNRVDPTTGISYPDQVISSQIVTLGGLKPGSGTFTEAPVPLGTAGPVPNPDGNLFQYNAELAVPAPDAKYPQVEWLKIVALTQNPNLQWGWHDRDYGVFNPLAAPTDGLSAPGVNHFMDDAVTGALTLGAAGVPLPTVGPVDPALVHETQMAPTNYIPAYDGIQSSKDLAFALYTRPTPEPGCFALMGLGIVGLAARRGYVKLRDAKARRA